MLLYPRLEQIEWLQDDRRGEARRASGEEVLIRGIASRSHVNGERWKGWEYSGCGER